MVLISVQKFFLFFSNFRIFRILNFVTSSNTLAQNTNNILLDNLSNKQSGVKFVQFLKKRFLSKHLKMIFPEK